MKTKFKKAALAAAVAGTFAGASTGAQAAAFGLIEQSGSGMGNAYAGAAATAEDASTIFFNPAGISFLEGKQVVVAGHLINVSAKFTDRGTTQNLGVAGSNTGGDAGDLAFVPNAYFSMPIDDRLSFGVGINVPFGLATEYDATWMGRYQGIKSELMTINVNPTISYKINPMVAVGFGVNYQYLEGELTNAVFTGGPDATAKLEADDDGWGWNVGVLAQISPTTRIGLSYRSAIDYTLEGTSTVTAANGTILANSPVTADIEMPDSYSLSVAHDVSDKLQLLGDVTFTDWSKIQDLVIRSNGATLDTLELRFDDSWRVSVGANYRYSERLILKGGVAYDQTPVKDEFRTVRLPDSDRTWLAIGAKYQFSNAASLDVGYAHLFIKDATINNTKAHPGGPLVSTVQGNFKGSVDILSVQYTHSF